MASRQLAIRKADETRLASPTVPEAHKLRQIVQILFRRLGYAELGKDDRQSCPLRRATHGTYAIALRAAGHDNHLI